MKPTAVIVLIVWLLSGLYLGVGGLSRAKLDDAAQEMATNKPNPAKDSINTQLDGVTVQSKQELNYLMESESVETYFPWAIKLSSSVSLIITSFSFGLLGAVIGLFKELVFSNKPVEELKFFSMPVLGLLTGLVVLGLSYLLPTVLVKNETEIRPLTLMFLCLFAGMYAENFYNKITQYFNKMFL